MDDHGRMTLKFDEDDHSKSGTSPIVFNNQQELGKKLENYYNSYT